jgi:hypothetical protein
MALLAVGKNQNKRDNETPGKKTRTADSREVTPTSPNHLCANVKNLCPCKNFWWQQYEPPTEE